MDEATTTEGTFCLQRLSSYAHGTKMQAAHDFYTTNGKTLQVGTNDLMPSVMPLLKRQRQNWLNAPDDGFFIATEETRKRRKQFTRSQLKRACRMPCTLILRKAKSLMTHKETQENLSSHSQMKAQQ